MSVLFSIILIVVGIFSMTPTIKNTTYANTPIIQSVEGLKDKENVNQYNPFQYLRWAYEESISSVRVVDFMNNNSYFVYNGVFLNSGQMRRSAVDDDFTIYRSVFWFDDIIPANMTFTFVIDRNNADSSEDRLRIVFQEQGTNIYTSAVPHYEGYTDTKCLYDNTYKSTRIYSFQTRVNTSHFHIEFASSRVTETYGILSLFAGDFTSRQTWNEGYGTGYEDGYTTGDAEGYQRGYDDGFIQTLESDESFFYGLIQIFKYMINQLAVLFDTKVIGDLNIAFFVIGIPGIFLIVNFGFRLVFRWIRG